MLLQQCQETKINRATPLLTTVDVQNHATQQNSPTTTTQK